MRHGNEPWLFVMSGTIWKLANVKNVSAKPANSNRPKVFLFKNERIKIYAKIKIRIQTNIFSFYLMNFHFNSPKKISQKLFQVQCWSFKIEVWFRSFKTRWTKAHFKRISSSSFAPNLSCTHKKAFMLAHRWRPICIFVPSTLFSA